MRYWPTLVMVLVLAGLGLYLYVIEFPKKESNERQDTADKKVLLFDQETLSVAAGAARETFSIGDSGPLSFTLYVLRESDRKVLLTNLAPKDFVNKSLMTFRRKDLLH